MSKNFKAMIRERYKGRGNTWVKISNTSPIYQQVISLLSNVESDDYLKNIEREGFAWVRFSKPAGTNENQKCLFEVRYRGSKIDHPDSILTLDNQVAKTLPLLGNTPLKLNLEPGQGKTTAKLAKKVVRKKEEKVKILNEKIELDNKIKSIKSQPLSNSTEVELKKWVEFLKAEDLLEHSI